VTAQHFAYDFTAQYHRAAYTAPPDRHPKDSAHMELIVTSFIAATFLLLGHLSVLVRNRLFGTR
jgi:hypothetical protein